MSAEQKQKSSRGHGSKSGEVERPNRQPDYTAELKAILRDIITGVLPLYELPGYLAWVFGGMK